MNTYLDIPGFQEQVNGADTTDILQASTVLTAPCSLGATSLTIASTVGFTVGRAVIFDGTASERVKITGIGSGTLNVSSTSFAHGTDVNIAQGPQALGLPAGSSLTQAIISASAWVENFTQRVLLSSSYTGEVSHLIQDKDNFVLVKPRQWPVTNFETMTVTLSDGSVSTLDVSQVKLVAGERMFKYTGPDGQSGPGVSFCRGDVGWTTIAYLAGYNPVPEDIKEACALRTMETVGHFINYQGASATQIDHTRVETRLRGDDGFDTIFVAQAKELLNQYVRRD